MLKSSLRKLILPLGFLLSSVPSGAQTIAASARHLERGGWRTAVFYQGTSDENLDFHVASSGSCAVPAGATANPFPCGSTGAIHAEGRSEAIVSRVTFQPHERMQYYATLGAGNYSLHFSSISVRGDRPGYLYGAGFRVLAMSESVMSPAIAFDLGGQMERYYLNNYGPASGSPRVNERLDFLRVQGALQASKRFELDEGISVEPYGGLKLARTRVWLKDLASGDRQGGAYDSAMPFVGLSLPVFGQEGFFAEASFVNGVSYAFGLTIGFGAGEKKA